MSEIPCLHCRTEDGERREPSHHPWDPRPPCPERFCRNGWLERALCDRCGMRFDAEDLRRKDRRWLCRECQIEEVLEGEALRVPVRAEEISLARFPFPIQKKKPQ